MCSGKNDVYKDKVPCIHCKLLVHSIEKEPEVTMYGFEIKSVECVCLSCGPYVYLLEDTEKPSVTTFDQNKWSDMFERMNDIIEDEGDD